MNLKPLIEGKNMNPNDYVFLLHHRLSWQFIVAFGLNKKVSCERLLGGGDLKYFETSISQRLCRVQ